jgi:GNAT superfamily N-acetyltransferase
MARPQPERGAVRNIRNPELRLDSLDVEEYVDSVLPHSATLWAGERSFERYSGDLRNFVASGYGRRRFRLIGLRTDSEIASSCKRYERDFRWGERSMRAVGIGAVFTRESLRGRGLATTMLAALLDQERAAGVDFAFLFSDIRPQFYEDLGFIALPSRVFTLRARALEFARIDPSPIRDDDWPRLSRCFAVMEKRRPFAFTRTPIVWDWMKRRYRSGSADVVNLAVRGPRGVFAYVLGRRIIKSDTYVVDEFAFASETHKHLVAPLVRAAAGDLARITGWVPPSAASAALQRGSTRPRRDAIFMIAPLSQAARQRWKNEGAEMLRSSSDPVWSTDHI